MKMNMRVVKFLINFIVGAHTVSMYSMWLYCVMIQSIIIRWFRLPADTGLRETAVEPSWTCVWAPALVWHRTCKGVFTQRQQQNRLGDHQEFAGWGLTWR